MDTPAPEIAALPFEAALAELETVVQSMEGGRLSLEASLATYQRGIGLLRHCQRLIAEAEQKVQTLENGELRDFRPEAGEAR